MNKIIQTNFTEFEITTSKLTKSNLIRDQIESVAQIIISRIYAGGKLLVCGNGGSAADSVHFVAELVSSFSKNISRKSLPAVSLATNISVITAYSNDFDFDGVFSRQVESLGQSGDVLFILSTSGESINCIRAIHEARNLGLTSIALTGESDSTISNIVDYRIQVPSNNTQRIQEMHVLIYHILSEIIESKLTQEN